MNPESVSNPVKNAPSFEGRAYQTNLSIQALTFLDIFPMVGPFLALRLCARKFSHGFDRLTAGSGFDNQS